MQAIMLRDPRALLSLIVKAHRANRRIDVEFRFWPNSIDAPGINLIFYYCLVMHLVRIEDLLRGDE